MVTGPVRDIRVIKSVGGPATHINSTDELYRVFVENIRDYALFSMTADGVITVWNAGAENLFGYERKEALGKHHSMLYTDFDKRKNAPGLDLRSAEISGSAHEERLQVRKDGSQFWAMGTITKLSHEAGRLAGGFAKVAHDITERKQREQTMWHQAFHDNLTGLPNRRLLFEHLQRAIALGKRKGCAFAVLFLDLDNFKLINDTIGHILADELLVITARRLEQSVRMYDIVARIGGDEFAIVMNATSSTQDAANLANRILARISKPYRLANRDILTTMSIGIAMGSTTHESPEQALHDADMAMYEAKAQGRSRYFIYNEQMLSQRGIAPVLGELPA